MNKLGKVFIAGVLVIGGAAQRVNAQKMVSTISSCDVQRTISHEMIASISQLEKHVNFLQGICGCNLDDLAYRFAGRARELDRTIAKKIEKKVKQRILTAQMVKDLQIAVRFFNDRGNKSDRLNLLAINPEKESLQAQSILEKHAAFVRPQRIFGLITLANWLWQQGKNLLSGQPALQLALEKTFDAFPFEQIEAVLQSKTLKDAVEEIKQNKSFDKFFICWASLKGLADDTLPSDVLDVFIQTFAADFQGICNEEVITQCIANALKECAQLVVVFINFVLTSCVENFGIKIDAQCKALNAEQLVDLYNKMSVLPIIETLTMLTQLSEQFSLVLKAVQAPQDGVGFDLWLKNNWFVFPVVIGVIIVRVVQFYLNTTATSKKITVTTFII